MGDVPDRRNIHRTVAIELSLAIHHAGFTRRPILTPDLRSLTDIRSPRLETTRIMGIGPGSQMEPPALSRLSCILCLLAAVPAFAEAPAKQRVDFSRQVRPLLASKCLKCHGPDREQRAGKLRLDLAENTVGKVIVPGKPSQSKLFLRITSADDEMKMPPPDSNLSLDPAEIEILKRWIAQGADYSVHWSFTAPQRPEVPRVPDTTWARNAIDHFVLSRMKQDDLRPSTAAGRETLIRRLTLDLTGLPPTVDEIDRFLADKSSRAWERVVDRLMSSQHYGERMARTWLDLARFGDTNGYENDSDRSMWLYRDWVINAFNTNMPYDRFTLDQVAGDLLPHASTAQRIASGFNRNTTYNEEGGSDPEEFQVVYAVERASTTGTVFLGLTLGCAQCHEHKYDPISQEEFYSFYAFFNSVDGEKGAQGHDIPLPPLLVLATPEQQHEQQQLKQDLGTLEKTIADAVAKVKLPPESSEEPPQEKQPPKTGTVENTTPPKPGEKMKPDGFFDRQSAWESYAKQHSDKLPKDINKLVTTDPDQRTAEQKQTLRTYFIRHGFRPVRETFEPLNKRHKKLTDRQAALTKLIPTTMIMKEMAQPRPAHLLIRGDFQQKGTQVRADVPSIFKPLPSQAPRNRLGLARWLIDPEHPLTARVAVNRIWSQFFGVGLVRTPEDFGVRGEFPTHPRLLDWLAVEFVRIGWNVKALQKQIVMSATYRQASRFNVALAKGDPFNRLLTRQNRFRLSAEAIRDTALSVSGLLDNRIGGPSVYPFQPEGYYSDKGRWKWPQSSGRDLYRRGLYTFWRRTTTYPSFQIFDAPTRELCTVQRPRTNTPLQALVTLNERTFVHSARVFAERILQHGGPSPQSRQLYAFRKALGRYPDKAEQTIFQDLLKKQLEHYRQNQEAADALVAQGPHEVPKDSNRAELATWTSMANLLLNLDETITRE